MKWPYRFLSRVTVVIKFIALLLSVESPYVEPAILLIVGLLARCPWQY